MRLRRRKRGAAQGGQLQCSSLQWQLDEIIFIYYLKIMLYIALNSLPFIKVGFPMILGSLIVESVTWAWIWAPNHN